MRIGFLTTEYTIGDDFKGGLGNYLRRITLTLATAGHEPHVFYFANRKPGIQVECGIHIHTINNHCSQLLSLLNTATRYRINQTVARLECSFRLRQYLLRATQQISLDIIQIPNYGSPGLLTTDVAPMVIRCSSYAPIWDKLDRINVNLDRRICTKLETIQYRRAAGVYAPTRLLADTLRNELNISNAAIIRTPFYLEIVEWDRQLYENKLQGRDYLLFFGRLSPLKGVQILAQALPHVWSQCPDLVAVFIGQEGKTNPMTDFIRQTSVGYEHNLVLLPPLDHKQLYPIIANARLVVLPSLFDNAPNTLLEAMGLGKPVIGTYGTSMDEFIEDGLSGFLVEPGDVKALAEKIAEAWRRVDLKEIGESARCVVADLSPENILPQLLKFYENHLN